MEVNIKNGISVVICCYNSADRITETLKHLAYQEFKKAIPWEIILVDNNCTDNTVETAKVTWTSLNEPAKLIIVKEAVPGLSAARHKGVKTSDFNYIIFCDDDNWLSSNYLETVFNILSLNENIAAVGGYGEAVTDGNFPDWFEQFSGGYAVGKPVYKTGILKNKDLLTGAGLGFKKSIYELAFSKIPSLLTDRKGKELSSGGDSEICLRFKLLNFQLYYDSSLTFKHFIPQERLTEEYCYNLYKGFKGSSEVINYYNLIIETRSFNLLKLLLELFKTIIRMPFSYLQLVKRWDFNRDVNLFFLLTGIEINNKVDQKIIKISSSF